MTCTLRVACNDWGVMLLRFDGGESDDATVHQDDGLVQQHVDASPLWLKRRPFAVKALGDEHAR